MKKFLIVSTAAMALAVSAFSQSAAGSWKGHLQLDASKMPKAQNAQQQAMMTKVMTTLQKLVFTLNMRPNKTFTINVPPMGAGQTAHSAEGTWTQTGRKVTMVATKNDGKAATGNDKKPQTMTISADGKMMTLVPTTASGGKIVFKR